MTDSWNGISPAWMALSIAVVCLFPGSHLVPERPIEALSFEPILYVAGIVGIGSLANWSGLGSCVADWVISVLPLAKSPSPAIFAMLSGFSTILALLITGPGVPAILTPMAPTLAQATGWSPEAVVMTQVIGFSTPILPYLAPPLAGGGGRYRPESPSAS